MRPIIHHRNPRTLGIVANVTHWVGEPIGDLERLEELRYIAQAGGHMLQRIKEEPVMFQGIIQAALALGLSFGLNLSSAQVGAILALSAAILSFWARSQVTPTVNPKTNDGTPLVPAKS
jgi:hypothetical protein